MDKFLEETLEIQNTNFYFQKLNAIPAFDVLESVRHEVGMTIDMEDFTGVVDVPDNLTGEERDKYLNMKATLNIVEQVLKLSPEFVKDLRRKMFKTINFTNEFAKTPQQLTESVLDMAFAGLGPTAIYRVLFQSLFINFYPFFQEIPLSF